MAREDTGVYVQAAVIFKHTALIEAKAFTIDKELDQEPIGSVGEFLFTDINIVEYAK
jgi:hypothetical protein